VQIKRNNKRILGFGDCWSIKSHQGFGVGTFALNAVIERYRELGMQRVLTAWHPGDGNAGDFYKKFGFIPTGEIIDDEIVAELKL
jgi:diamine N-acetyltransferase